MKKAPTSYVGIILPSAFVLICLLFLGKYIYSRLTFSATLAETIKTEVQVLPNKALPGDTVIYLVSVTYWGKYDEYKDASLLYEVEGITFLENTLKVRKGNLSDGMIRFPEEKSHFWLNEIDWDNQDKGISKKLLSFSVKGIIPAEVEKANTTYPCVISAITDEYAIKLKNPTAKEGSLSVEYAPFEVKSRMVSGRPVPGQTLTYETSVLALEDLEPTLKQVQLIDVFNSSYIDIIPSSVRIYTKRRYSKPEIAQNSLYIDKMDIEAGEDVKVVYKVLSSESAPKAIIIQNVATAFIPDTKISHSNSATIELALLSLLPM